MTQNQTGIYNKNYSDEDRHACKKNVQTMSKAGKKLF